MTLLVEQCHRAIVGVRGSEPGIVAVDSESADQSVSQPAIAAVFDEAVTSLESDTVPTEVVSNDVQCEILDSVHQEIPEVRQARIPETVADSVLGDIAARLGKLNDPNVDTQELAAALMSLAQVLGTDSSSVERTADSIS